MSFSDLAKPSLDSLKIPDEHRGEKPTGKLWWVLSVSLLLVGIAWWSWQARENAPVEVELTTVRPIEDRGSLAVLSASGYVQPRRRATIAAKITGQIVELLVEEGMAVEPGQVLARIDDTQARAQWEAARAEVAVAQATVESASVRLEEAERIERRLAPLARQALLDSESYDRAAAAVVVAQASLAMAKSQLESARAREAAAQRYWEDHTIKAPFAGIAVSKDAQLGEMVSPVSAGGGFTRTGISTIVDMQSLEIEVDVNENYIARVRTGQPVRAVLDAYPDWNIPARVRTLIPTADRQKATVKVRISFLSLDPRILPDMGVKVFFLEDQDSTTGAPAAALYIPADAVLKSEGGAFVWLYRSGLLERRAIGIGASRLHLVEVTAGLAAGDRIVSRPTPELRAGQAVKPRS